MGQRMRRKRHRGYLYGVCVGNTRLVGRTIVGYTHLVVTMRAEHVPGQAHRECPSLLMVCFFR